MRDPRNQAVKMAEHYTVVVKITRTDRVSYPGGDYGQTMSPPISEEHEQVSITSSQDDLASAVDMAIALLKLQHPDGD